MGSSKQTYQAFLSYARENEAEAMRIYKGLRKRGVEVWFDQERLSAGDTWKSEIEKQLQGAGTTFFAIVMLR